MRFVLRAGVAAALAVTAINLSPASAAPAATWSIQPSPNPTTPQDQLAAVSCTASTTCMSVGSSINPGGVTVPLAESLSSKTWTVRSVPTPAHSTGSLLSGVSCTSSTASPACIAVGTSFTASHQQLPLAESWNGSAWSLQPAPAVAGSLETVLLGVSCTATNACTAVGFSFASTGAVTTLAERWNGSAWTIQTTPNPSGNGYAQFTSVACTAPTSCTAVGWYENVFAANRPLAEIWNGTTWAVRTPPNPTGSPDTQLMGISCTASTACTATGTATSSGVQQTLAEVWNGSAWTIQTTPPITGAQSATFAGVSCASTTCMAVGQYTNSAGATITLAESRTGGTGGAWTVSPTHGPSGSISSSLAGVSCTATAACTAAGEAAGTGSTLTTAAESWNGTAWTVERTPNPTGALFSTLAGVACASATACTAVGSAGAGTLAEAWNGTRWTLQPTPNVALPQRINSLQAVACVATNGCTAVGFSEDRYSADSTLVETWNGSRWAIQPSPNPPSSFSSQLRGVSCTATACAAVGGTDLTPSSYVQPLAEIRSGTTWTVRSVPLPAGSQGGELLGVSCRSATACIAVGDSFASIGSFVPLAESWNGTAWSIQPTPAPSGATETTLTGVSCSSSASCMAAGYDDDAAGTQLTAAETWNGKSWRVTSTPNVAGMQSNYLAGVSCSAATACSAVGTSSDSAGNAFTLALWWNGTSWSLQSTPNAMGKGVVSLLEGASCNPSATCTAVGFSASSAGATPDRTLVEHYA